MFFSIFADSVLDTNSWGYGLANLFPQKHKPVGGFKDSNQFINQYKQPTKTKNLRIQAGEAGICDNLMKFSYIPGVGAMVS